MSDVIGYSYYRLPHHNRCLKNSLNFKAGKFGDIRTQERTRRRRQDEEQVVGT